MRVSNHVISLAGALYATHHRPAQQKPELDTIEPFKAALAEAMDVIDSLEDGHPFTDAAGRQYRLIAHDGEIHLISDESTARR